MNINLKEFYLKELCISLFIICLSQCIANYTLRQEIRTLNMLMRFDWDIINNREKLLDDNNIKYDDYIYIEKDK